MQETRSLNTYTVLGGYLLYSSVYRALPSKKVNFRNIKTFLPGLTNSNALSTNSFAYLYGGLVSMSQLVNPFGSEVALRKSIPPRRIASVNKVGGINYVAEIL